MALELKRKQKSFYYIGFLGLLVIEILIARFVNDDFVRPYLGDFLVVILIYCFLMAVSRLSVLKGLLTVLIFSFAVEFFQLVNIVKVLQYQPPKIVMIMLGTSFSVWDLIAYVLGLATCFLIEYRGNFTIDRLQSPEDI